MSSSSPCLPDRRLRPKAPGAVLAFFVAWAFSSAPLAAEAQGRVLVMASPSEGPPIAAALGVELAGRGTEILVCGEPGGVTRVERAASAQASARAAGAVAAVWLDSIDGVAGPVPMVRVAPSADADFRQAPLPADTARDPRAVALIAASLLEELLGPPDPPPSAAMDLDIHAELDVHVHAEPEARTSPEDAPPIIVLDGEPPNPSEADPTIESSGPTLMASATLTGRVLGLDDRVDGGLSGRGMLGLRFDGTWRLGVELEALLATEHPGNPQDTALGGGVSFGFVGGGELALGDLALVLTTFLHAAHQETWEWQTTDATVARTFWTWAARWGVRAALAIPLKDALNLEVGIELGFVARSAEHRSAFRGDLAVLTFGLSWQ